MTRQEFLSLYCFFTDFIFGLEKKFTEHTVTFQNAMCSVTINVNISWGGAVVLKLPFKDMT